MDKFTVVGLNENNDVIVMTGYFDTEQIAQEFLDDHRESFDFYANVEVHPLAN